MKTKSEWQQRPVIKLGGITVASTTNILKTLTSIRWNEEPILIVSAPAGITDQLLNCAQLNGDNRHQALQSVRWHFADIAMGLLSDASRKCYLGIIDRWLQQHAATSSTERLVARGELWNAHLIAAHLSENSLPAYPVDARKFVLTESSDKPAIITDDIKAHLTAQGIAVVTGFIARNRQHNSCTLGRDGSDYTAALIAAKTAACRVDFITSTRGIRSADPAQLGSPGLRIPMIDYPAARTIARLGGGVLHPRTIGPLQQHNIPVRVFQPAQAAHATHIMADARWPLLGLGIFTRTVSPHLSELLIPVANPAIARRLAPILSRKLQQRPELPTQSCSAEHDKVHITCVPEMLNLCLRAVHDELYGTSLHPDTKQSSLPRVAVVLYGPGKVGNAVIDRLHQQQWLTRLDHRLHLHLHAVVNSEYACKQSEGGKTTQTTSQALWQEIATNPAITPDFTVVIDTTAAREVARQHRYWLNQGFGVITANKLSLSADDHTYLELQVHPLFAASATVGAGLPIITTLKQLQNAGQTPTGFTAILSGSVNYLLEQLQQHPDYNQAMAQAQQLGLVEADPHTDISGLDTARKSIILARLLGDQLTVKDVECQPLPPAKQLEQLALNANDTQQRLVYLAHWEPGQISIRLESVAADSSLVITGVNNIIKISSGDQQKNIIISGPGAGIEVTADAVFRDLFMTVKQGLLLVNPAAAMAA